MCTSTRLAACICHSAPQHSSPTLSAVRACLQVHLAIFMCHTICAVLCATRVRPQAIMGFVCTGRLLTLCCLGFHVLPIPASFDAVSAVLLGGPCPTNPSFV